MVQVLQCSHLDIIHGARQFAVHSTIQELRSQPGTVAFYHKHHPLSVPVFGIRVLIFEDHIIALLRQPSD